MRGILSAFARKPVKARYEYGDSRGRVLLFNVDHFDQRSFNALVARDMLDYFKRCGCIHPCVCSNGGWHITDKGLAALASPGKM
jgi:hypothetical protein